MKYIDTHCHLQSDFYDESEVETLIREAKENNIEKLIVVGTTQNSSIELMRLAHKHDGFLLPTFGIHPSDANSFDDETFSHFNPDYYCAIGEVGIDLYHENNPHIDQQIFVFESFIDLARAHNKPLIIHMRDSEYQVYEILKQYKDIKFVMHSFTASQEWAKKFIELGAYISFSGIVTFKNAKELQEVAKIVPLEKILCETDAPFLTPMPYRGQKNKPHYVKHVVEKIAELKNLPLEQVTETILNNSKTLFNIK